MIADLLESTQQSQNEPTTLDTAGTVHFLHHRLDDFFIERRLLLGEGRVLLRIHASGKIGDHVAIGLEATQDEGHTMLRS